MDRLCVIAVRVLDLVVLLARPGIRMLSVDIVSWTVTGQQEAASGLALLQTAWSSPAILPRASSSAACRAARTRCKALVGPAAGRRYTSAVSIGRNRFLLSLTQTRGRRWRR